MAAVAEAPAARIYTNDTQAQIPTGVTRAGHKYGIEVTAIYAPGTDLTVTPHHHSVPYGSASAHTAVLAF
jgi:hypothetical protein